MWSFRETTETENLLKIFGRKSETAVKRFEKERRRRTLSTKKEEERCNDQQR
jgi:hypothetical protein